MRRALVTSLILMAVSGAAIRAAAASTNAVSQYGITWTFGQNHAVGQFANGDWWVVGPVSIANIVPKTGDGGIDYSNGSMLNPIPGQTQGFYRNGADNNPENQPKYDASKNISLQLPIAVPPGNSVYSVMNNPDTWTKGEPMEKTWFKETAVLTVLAAAPPAGSFRPPYAGNDKTIKIHWTVASLDYSALKSLDIPKKQNAPSMEWLEKATQRPLLEMEYNWMNSNWKAAWADNKPGGYPRRTYGREIAGIAGGAGLMLNTNLKDKEKLLINMVQWGIDTYGLLNAGMQWQSNGGHQFGRLMPIYIAGKVLNDPQMLAKATGDSPLQEMINHYFITQADIDAPRAEHTPPHKPYTKAMLGMPEWSSGGRSEQTTASAAWNEGDEGFAASGYRFVNGGPNCGIVAAILIMGGRAEVKQEAYFKYYIERYYPKEKPSGDGVFRYDSNSVQPFVRDMWDAYVGEEGVVRGKVSQSMAIPDDPIREDVELPPIAPIIGKAVNNRYIYGLYVWAGEYFRFREDIQKVGWKFIRLAGPLDGKIVDVLKADDVQVMYTFGTHMRSVAKPEEDKAFIEDYGKQLGDLIRRYDLKKPKFSIECWNEPNFGYLIQKGTEADREALYAKLLPEAYRVAKEADLQLVGFGAGGAGAGDVRFFKNVHNLNPAVAKSYDVVSTHPYVDGNGDAAAPEHYKQEPWGRYSIASCLAESRQHFAAHGRADVPIWFTEIGWKISKKDGGRYDQVGIPAEFVAAYTCRLYAYALRLGVERVSNMFAGDTDGYNGGFFADDGTWRPSAHATKVMIEQMPEPKLVEAISDGKDGYFAYLFQPSSASGSKRVIMAWNATGPKVVDIPVAGAQVTVLDMLGDSQVAQVRDGKLKIELGPFPMYIK